MGNLQQWGNWQIQEIYDFPRHFSAIRVHAIYLSASQSLPSFDWKLIQFVQTFLKSFFFLSHHNLQIFFPALRKDYLISSLRLWLTLSMAATNSSRVTYLIGQTHEKIKKDQIILKV